MKKMDKVINDIATYACSPIIPNVKTLSTAKEALADALGCAILALQYPACTRLLGPIVPGTIVPHGCRVPGTPYILDPITGAFNIGAMIRWLDFNDTWLAAEWAHPSDNLGGILAVADYLSRSNKKEKKLLIFDVLQYLIKAYEIQGVLALGNSLNRIGFDHVLFVKIATTAVVTVMLGGTKDVVANAVSNAWIDTGPLRTYRHAPNTGTRKSWAAADATSRGVFLAMMAMKGEMGYQQGLSAPRWGFNDVLFKEKPIFFQRPLDTYVMDNILFKLSYPTEFHAQTAAECAVKLHSKIKNKIDNIKIINIETHESAIRIIDKKGPLHNPADRDHCLQYIVAVALLKGDLTADDYEDKASKNPSIDKLRKKMNVLEKKQYSKDYLDPKKRSIANSITIHFNDGTPSLSEEVQYPLGHRKRREEGKPYLYRKFEENLSTHFARKKAQDIVHLFENHDRLFAMPVDAFCDIFALKKNNSP